MPNKQDPRRQRLLLLTGNKWESPSEASREERNVKDPAEAGNEEAEKQTLKSAS